MDPTAGALVRVELHLQDDELERRQSEHALIPPPLRGRGLIDIGAEVSCLTAAAAHALALGPTRRFRVSTASGFRLSNVYPVKVTLGWDMETPPDPIELESPEVEVHGADILIGRDVLSMAEFVLYGPDARFELVLPRNGSQFR